MQQNYRITGLINWLSLLAVTALGVALARYASTAAGMVGVTFLVLGFLVAAVSYFQMRLGAREEFERLEFEELKKAKGESALFADAESFSARRSREQFERYLVPAFSFLLLAMQSWVAVYGWRWATKMGPPVVDKATMAIFFYALFALVLFLLGKYSAGLARLDRQRLLRPGAGYLMLGSVVCFLAAGVEAAAWFGFPQVDLYVARAFCVVLGLTALETLVSLVLEIYRPRVRGQAVRLLYESRLIGLLGQPGGLITTAAQALDYQFGFKVSETWFYKFLERAFSWVVLLQLGVLFLTTAVVIVEPGEQALLERWGKPVAARPVLDSGLHLKWPWPIDQVYRFPTRQIQSFVIGVVPDPELEKERVVLWTRPHYKEEFNMLVASRDPSERVAAAGAEKPVPANLLVASIPVHYEVTNLVQWTYQHQDAGKLLEDIANREVVRHFVNVDLDLVMSSELMASSRALRERIQAQADALALGVRVVWVGLQNIHPPIGDKMLPVAASFEQVVGAMQKKETNVLAAQAYQARQVPAAQAEGSNAISRAQGERVLKVQTAAGEADRFLKQDAAYQASPNAYRQRVYLDTLARTIAPVRKYVLAATNTTEVLQMNLEEKVRSDLASGVILPPDAFKPAEPKKE